MIETPQPPTETEYNPIKKSPLPPQLRRLIALGIVALHMLITPPGFVQASPNPPGTPRGDKGPTTVLVAEASLPLAPRENYTGKYPNAENAAKQINDRMPFLEPGDKFHILEDNILTFNRSEGYVETPYGYAYGVCWSVSALHQAILNANELFKAKYGIPLFIIEERHPHSHYHETYGENDAAIFKNERGEIILDYTAQVNPEIANYRHLRGLKVKIRQIYSANDPKTINSFVEIWIPRGVHIRNGKIFYDVYTIPVKQSDNLE